MPIAKITGPGLAAIGLAVALLWGCALGERGLMGRARAERAQVLRDMERLRQGQRPQPAYLPSPRNSHPARATAG